MTESENSEGKNTLEPCSSISQFICIIIISSAAWCYVLLLLWLHFLNYRAFEMSLGEFLSQLRSDWKRINFELSPQLEPCFDLFLVIFIG